MKYLRFRIIDFLRHTSVIEEYVQIAEEYSLSQAELTALRNKKLVDFLFRLKENTFWGGYLADYSYYDIENTPGEIMKNLPVTDKSFYQKNFDDIFCPSNGRHECRYTGGSTGTPFRYVADKKSISRIRGFNYYLWHKFLGFQPGDSILAIGGSSLGANQGYKKRIYNFLQKKVFLPGDVISETDFNQHLKLLVDAQYKFIYGYPSAILMWLNIFESKGIKFPRSVQGIITTSEMLYPDQKKRIEDFFKTSVLNVYGALDGGIISGSNEIDDFFYNGLDCFVESVPVQGNEGSSELILTNLNDRVFPFVRYKVGDLAEINDFSDNDFPFKLCKLQGRTRDFFSNSKGTMFHGSLINKVLKQYNRVEQYQLIQQSDYSITLYVKTKKIEDVESIRQSISRDLVQLLEEETDINIEYCQTFNSKANGKHKVIISHAK